MARQPHLAHAARAEPLDQAVAADAQVVVEELLADLEDRALTRREREAQDVAKFTEVARPPVVLQSLQRLVRQDRNDPPRLLGQTTEDERRERRQIVQSIAQ